MGIVEFLGLPTRVTVGAALVLLVGSVTFSAWYVCRQWLPAAPPERVAMAYYYDLNTSQLFEAPRDLTVPVETPSGSFHGQRAGVLAHVVSCGKCWDPEQRYVGWIEAPAETVQAAGLPLPAAPQSAEGICEIVIRRPADAGWVYLTSPEGKKIVEEAQSACSGTEGVSLCQPNEKRLSELEPAHREAVEAARERERELKREVDRERPLELEKERELERASVEFNSGTNEPMPAAAPK